MKAEKRRDKKIENVPSHCDVEKSKHENSGYFPKTKTKKRRILPAKSKKKNAEAMKSEKLTP